MMKLNSKIVIFALTGLMFLAGASAGWAQTGAPTEMDLLANANVVQLKEESDIQPKIVELKNRQKTNYEQYKQKRAALEEQQKAARKKLNDNKIYVAGHLVNSGSITVIDHSKGVDYVPKDGDDKNKAQGMVNEYNQIVKQINELDKGYILEKNNIINQLAVLESSNDGDLYQFVDPKTSKVTYYRKKGDSWISETGVTKGCMPLPVKIALDQGCIFCPLFTIIYNTAQQMATASYGALSGAMAQIMLLGFGIWVAFRVLGQVSSFTKQDGPKFITELLIQAFKVLVAFYLLMSASGIYNYVVGPMLQAGIEFGTAMLFDIDASANCGASIGLVNEPGVLPTYLHEKILCFLEAVQKEIGIAQAISSTLMCVGREAAKSSVFYRVGIFAWDYSMLIQGAVIFVFSWLISLAFAFYLVDATVRLGIVGTLMPFLIACWPFKATRKYTSTGWNMFMNTFFTYVFTGLVIMVNIRLMEQAVTGGTGGWAEIQEALNGDDVQKLKEVLSIGFSGFIVLIACCLFGFKLTNQAGDLAGKMSGGGGGKDIAPAIAGGAASLGTTLGKEGGKTLWKGTKIVAGSKPVAKGVTAVKQGIRAGARGSRRFVDNMAYTVLTDQDGNTRYSTLSNSKGYTQEEWDQIKYGRRGRPGGQGDGQNPDGSATPTPDPTVAPVADGGAPTPSPEQTPNQPQNATRSRDQIVDELNRLRVEIAALGGGRNNPVKFQNIPRRNQLIKRQQQLNKELAQLDEAQQQGSGTAAPTLAQPGTGTPAQPAVGSVGTPAEGTSPAQPEAGAAVGDASETETSTSPSSPSPTPGSFGSSTDDKWRRKAKEYKRKADDRKDKIEALKDENNTVQNILDTEKMKNIEADIAKGGTGTETPNTSTSEGSTSGSESETKSPQPDSQPEKSSDKK